MDRVSSLDPTCTLSLVRLVIDLASSMLEISISKRVTIADGVRLLSSNTKDLMDDCACCVVMVPSAMFLVVFLRECSGYGIVVEKYKRTIKCSAYKPFMESFG